MARPLRLEFEGACYHITSRGNLRDRIVKSTENYRWASYREYIGAYKKKESIVDTAETLSSFSKVKTAAMKAYREFVKEGIGERNNSCETLKRVETRIKREKKFQKEIEVLKKQLIIEQ